jgi:hypothetical protein
MSADRDAKRVPGPKLPAAALNNGSRVFRELTPYTFDKQFEGNYNAMATRDARAPTDDGKQV